jgi:hypothetical protein
MDDVLVTILGSGVVAALATAIVQFVLRKIEEHRIRAYGALRVVVVLERYALLCADMVDERQRDFRGEAISSLRALPDFPQFPGDIDWRLLNKKQSERALTLPLEIEIANGVLAHISGEAPGDDGLSAVYMRQAGRLGWRSWLLAGEMRRTAGLPEPDRTRMAWDFPRMLSTYAKDEEARRDASPVAALA